jgi:hypothetical protein
MNSLAINSRGYKVADNLPGSKLLNEAKTKANKQIKDKKEMKKLTINPSVKTVAITLSLVTLFTLGGFAGAWVQRQFDAYVDQAVHEAVASQSKQ